MSLPSPQDFVFAMVIGGGFGVLAALCAFVISYSSYHNQFMDTRKPADLAIRSAITTFFVFLFLSGFVALAFRATRG